MSEQYGTVQAGDRVVIDHSGESGIVVAVYDECQEDRLEVQIPSGRAGWRDTWRYTACDERHVTVVGRGVAV